ncbi:fluoride efflux transporter FluC [Nocardioides jensenii]|uniref:fluoride efflux transporter FluC n=1 Tax=Nocardioides jensenii TaxID=1843 RepID=UPI00082AB322|nr:CrcB family protein [Nocardioides jensenii]
MTVLLVALGAAVGAPLRYVTGHVLDRDLPIGTLLVNVVGSFALGVLSALGLTGHTMALLGVGFCGGLTTYSSFAVQTSRLGARRGTTYVVLTLVLSLTACALGFATQA